MTWKPSKATRELIGTRRIAIAVRRWDRQTPMPVKMPDGSTVELVPLRLVTLDSRKPVGAIVVLLAVVALVGWILWQAMP